MIGKSHDIAIIFILLFILFNDSINKLTKKNENKKQFQLNM